MTIESTLALAGTLFILAVIPGPGVMAVTACALGRGTRPALAMTAGIVVGDMVYLSAAVFGLALLAQAMGDLFFLIRLCGAAYLVWLGVKLWRADPALHLARDTSRDTGMIGPAASGLAVTLGNPKAIAFYLGLLPTFVDMTAVTRQDFAVLAVITVVVIGGSVGAYAIAAGRMRTVMRNPQRVRWMNRTAGTLMIGTGAALAVKS